MASAQQNPYEYITGHPRIIMSKYDELALRFIMLEDPLAAKLKAELKKDADKLLSAKDLKYSRDKNGSIGESSEEYLKRILTLSLAYRIFEDEKYSDKAIDQMLDACAFPDWNPGYFIDAATMTAALAIGYDWNFYRLDLRQNETIRNRILEFGLNPGLEVYKNPEGKTLVWFKMDNYWNQVCASGLILGALAVGDDFPDVKNQALYHAVRNLLPTIELYEPDGVWAQGPASWVLANNYLTMAMSAMTASLGHDFGLSSRPGMDKAASWYTKMTGPSGKTFNFGLSSAKQITIAPALAWYSGIYDENLPNKLFRSQIEKQLSGNVLYRKDALFYLSLPWIKSLNESEVTIDRLTVQEGIIDMMVFNGNGDNNENLYLASKDYTQAMAAYDDAFRKKPDFVPAIFAQGALFDQLGKKKEAVAKYRIVLDKSESYVPALNNLAYLCASGYGSKEEALRLSISAFKKDPGNAGVMDTLGFALLKNNRLEDAKKVLEKAVKLLPDNPTVSFHLALAYKESGDKANALKMLQKALSLGEFDDSKTAVSLVAELKK